MKTLKLNRLIPVAVLPVAAAAVMATLPAQVANAASDTQAGATRNTASQNTASQNTTAKRAESMPYRALRASQVIGKEVRNPEGRNIGQINDLVINMNSGQVRYAVLEFDPGIFEGERLFAVPTSQLRLGSGDQLVYNMTRDKLEKVAVPRADWDTRWRDPAYLSNADKVWGVTQPSGNAPAYRASDLLGMDVRSRSGEDIGDLEELVINMAGQKVHYAVLAFDPSWTTPEKNYAFPLSAFKLGREKEELVLDVDKSKVHAMKGFDDARYSNLNDRNWVVDVDRYLVTIVPTGTRDSATTSSASSRSTTAMTSGSTGGSANRADTFSRLDRDNNGWLSRAELKDNAEIGRDWARLDADSNDRISRDEFMNGHATATAGSGNTKESKQ